METLLERLENISHLELEELDVSGNYTRAEKAWQCPITDSQVIYAKQRFKKFYYKVTFPHTKDLYMHIACMEKGEYILYEFASYGFVDRRMTVAKNLDIYCPLFPIGNGWLADIKIEKKVITLRICMDDYLYSKTMRIVSHSQSIHELYNILSNMKHGDKLAFEGFEFKKDADYIFYERM